MEKYINIVSFWAKELIGNDTKYNIDYVEQGKNLTINITIDKNDMGKIIGKNGNIITSIRNLINSISKKDKKNVKIIVKDI